jgi:FkbM family methyltransferase
MGYFTLQLADIFLQKTQTGGLSVCVVEASPRVTAELRRRLVIPDSRVKTNILNGLAGMREGSARLNLGKEDTVNFVGDATDESARPRGVETVPYVDLIAATTDMPVVHLIKCDIEGSEFPLIESYPDLLRKTRRIVIEFHSPFGDIARACETLKALGFAKMSVLRESPVAPTICFSKG